MVRGLELSVPLPDFQGGEKGLKLNQLLMTNDLVNHDYVIKLHKNPKEQPDSPFLESFHVGEPECFHVPPCQAPNSTKTEAPTFRTSLHISFHLAVDLYPL